jgi:NitT/TauT family transport system ATP-binding protein
MNVPHVGAGDVESVAAHPSRYEGETLSHSDAPLLVEVSGLSKTYGNGDTAKLAIDDVTFDVHTGEFLSIVGPSGAGKTTLLKCLSGLMPATSGTATFEGVPVDGPPAKMALVFQDYSRSLFPWMTIEGNVGLPLKAKGLGAAERRQRVADALESVGLADALKRYPWQLSGGMQQRAALARAVAYQPDCLLLDEPFASVDAQTRFDLEDLVLRLRHEIGVTVIFVTHDIDEAVYMSDRVVVLSASPCRVTATLSVDMPRPRDQIETRSAPQFASLRTELFELVRGLPVTTHAERTR